MQTAHSKQHKAKYIYSFKNRFFVVTNISKFCLDIAIGAWQSDRVLLLRYDLF